MKQMFSYVVKAFALLFILTSCNYQEEVKQKGKEYTLTYKVYYTDKNIVEYTITNNVGYEVSSCKGTNFIYEVQTNLTFPPTPTSVIISTSAPIEVVKYECKVLIK